MKKFVDLETWAPKKQRSLRNALNNRMSSFQKGTKVTVLPPGHKLSGLTQVECVELLARIQGILKKQKRVERKLEL